MSGNVVVRCDEVDFDFGHTKPILREANFTVRRGSKVALMGQNGAGKSTIFKLLTQELEPHEGKIITDSRFTVATAKQVIDQNEYDLTVRDYFQNAFSEIVYDIDPRIDEVLSIVNLETDKERTLKTFSGGQKARLLLAYALIQKPDLLLLDEPTNNLDKEGVAHLEEFLKTYNKTCIVISHDARFLNEFTDGVLYLDAFTHTVEQYVGNYDDVVREIGVRISKEKTKNVRLEKQIQAKKDQSNVFANKGGKMRVVAKRMRQKAETLEEDKVDVRREDKTISTFSIPLPEGTPGTIARLHTVPVIKKGEQKEKQVKIELHKGDVVLVKGPNGIGKTSFLDSFYQHPERFAEAYSGATVGYYRQDFSTLDQSKTVFEILEESTTIADEEKIRATAAKFLIGADVIFKKIESLSEGQKGLVMFARLVLVEPSLLILDEPSNHINFRHLPVIADAASRFEGALMLVSHDDEFLRDISVTETLDLERL